MSSSSRPSPGPMRAAPTVRRSVQRLSRRLRAQRPPDALPVLSLSLLASLYDNGPSTATALARHSRTTPQSVTRPLEALHRDELVERHPDPSDGRQHLLSITGKGLAALATDAAPRDAWLEDAMAELLTDAERDVLLVAARLLDRLSAHRPEVSR